MFLCGQSGSADVRLETNSHLSRARLSRLRRSTGLREVGGSTPGSSCPHVEGMMSKMLNTKTAPDGQAASCGRCVRVRACGCEMNNGAFFLFLVNSTFEWGRFFNFFIQKLCSLTSWPHDVRCCHVFCAPPVGASGSMKSLFILFRKNEKVQAVNSV